MKRRELMAMVALASGLSSSLSTTTHAYAKQPSAAAIEQGGKVHPGHFIGKGHFSHGNGNGFGHNHHDHDIY